MNTQTKSFDMSPISDIVSRSVTALRKLTDRKKTMCEVLQGNLTDEEFKNICKYITVAEAEKECKSIDEALTCFNWSATKEGRMYWAKIYSRFES